MPRIKRTLSSSQSVSFLLDYKSMLKEGEMVGPYVIEKPIGSGAAAHVYKAKHKESGQIAAIKVVMGDWAVDPILRQRFEREAIALANLKHPNIPALFEYGVESEAAWLASEYIEGGNLLDFNDEWPWKESQVVLALRGVGEALDYARSMGVIHRDVKPDNILFQEDGSTFLADFGLVRMEGTNTLTAFGNTLGSPAYMSPEQCQGIELTGASDIYSLGVVAYQMLTGSLPFTEGNSTAMLLAHVHSVPAKPSRHNSKVTDRAEKMLLMALAKEPNQRPYSASAFVEGLISEVSLIPPTLENTKAGEERKWKMPFIRKPKA